MGSIRETDATVVRLLTNVVPPRYTTGAAVEAGEAVYLDSSGYIQPANGGAVATNFAIGVSLQDIASGGRGDVAIGGMRVLCLTGATPGGIVYTMDTAGEIDHTGGTKKCVVGVAESATVLLVMPTMVSFS
jgi:hypothetical protein